jgi:hypothetical protein
MIYFFMLKDFFYNKIDPFKIINFLLNTFMSVFIIFLLLISYIKIFINNDNNEYFIND